MHDEGYRPQADRSIPISFRRPSLNAATLPGTMAEVVAATAAPECGSVAFTCARRNVNAVVSRNCGVVPLMPAQAYAAVMVGTRDTGARLSIVSTRRTRPRPARKPRFL